jgi:hypothetical protein
MTTLLRLLALAAMGLGIRAALRWRARQKRQRNTVVFADFRGNRRVANAVTRVRR